MKVALFVKSARIGLFFELLATGFMVKASTGVSVREFLCAGLGVDPAYVDTRIQTIFLDGKALDDIDGATLSDGSVLALSGAMPGLAGAVFRRGGAYGALRSNVVTSADKQFREPSAEGNVVLKLFNITAADLGPIFLKKGIRLSGKTLSRFLHQHLESLLKICAFMEIDGERYSSNTLTEMKYDSDEVELIVELT
jgi:hypothetical protein